MGDLSEDLPLFTSQAKKAHAPGSQPEAAGRIRATTSLNAAIRAWSEALEEQGATLNTIRAFTSDVRLLARFVGAGQSVNAVGTHDIKNFLEWMVERRGIACAPKTYSRRVTSVKAFFRWLSEAGVLGENVADPVPQQTVLSPLPEVLSSEEMEAVLGKANELRHGDKPDARPYALASMLLSTGIKKSECLAIHLNHVDLNDVDGPILFVRYADLAKRYRERKLPLPSEWVSAYREYLAQYHPGTRLFPYSPRRLEYLLEDLGEAAGLAKHLSFNMCRWTCALNDYRSGSDRDRIRQKLGLSKIQWREIGAKLDRLAAKEQATAA